MLGLFYKPDENAVLFNLYKTIVAETNQALAHNSQAFFTYNDLCRKVNSAKHGKASAQKRAKVPSEKLIPQDAAHYCKKLEKCGFLVCECYANSSEKKISMRKQDFKLTSKRRNQLSADQLFKAISGLQTNSPPLPSKRIRPS